MPPRSGLAVRNADDFGGSPQWLNRWGKALDTFSCGTHGVLERLCK